MARPLNSAQRNQKINIKTIWKITFRKFIKTVCNYQFMYFLCHIILFVSYCSILIVITAVCGL